MAIFRFSNAGGFGTYQRYNDFLAGNPTTPIITDFGSMFPLGVFTLSSAQANVEFTNIPQTYTHLQLRWIGRITASTTNENMRVQVGNNSIDTGSNYSQHYLYGTGSSAAAGGDANQAGMNLGRLTGASSTANIFAAGIIDILDYKNTSKNKTFRALAGNDQNGSGWVWFASGNWRSTSAINQIRITQLFGSGDFAANSSFALYGIK